MALRANVRQLQMPSGEEQTVPPKWSNDGFSFWGLPEQWRAPLKSLIDTSRETTQWYLLEYYLSEQERRPPAKLKAYYRVKKFIPAWLRYRLNSSAVRLRRARDFPSWPCESALIEFWRGWMRESLQRLGVSDGYHIGFWPHGKSCCIVLTHDVESPLGMARMERMADLEERWGFRSAWNLPLAQYEIDWKLVERLKERGFEFGAHGLCHDGRLFRSERDFNILAPLLQRLAREHDLRGFRSPSTLRCAELIEKLDFDFDASFADTDPYEPQPGGSCSIFPYFLGNLVELPYTLPQDHTLIQLLRRDPLSVWTVKASWVASLGGMVLTLVHPDYCGSGSYLRLYEELLKHLATIESAWRALPSQVAAWWRKRATMTLHIADGVPIITDDGEATDAVAKLLSAEPLLAGD
jgi:hypothetical protein